MVHNLEAKVDSRLVANQLNGSYVAKEQSMIQYLEKEKMLISSFRKFSIEQVPRSKNNKAYAISTERLLSVSFTKPNKSGRGAERKGLIEEEKKFKTALCKRREIKSDNGKQFRDNPFKDWCEKQKILNKDYASVKHPRDQLTVPKSQPQPGRSIKREKSASQEKKSKAKMEKYYNAKVRSTTFKPGDFVYRSNEASHNKEGRKLGPKWEGPYEVVEALGKGAYKIRNDSGDILPRTWNV
ncbi:reverse transcriptase domain-containing protein [Tanacetum coccineum]